jgi:TPP-dependent trihydroxycyclohexane-1,2-dione (THcHDO) dehydratase
VLNAHAERRLSASEADGYSTAWLANRHTLGLTGVDAADRAAHQAEVLAAYGTTTSAFGPASADGESVSAVLEDEVRTRDDDKASVDP